MIFIGAESIVSPLGNDAQENFENVLAGVSGVKTHENSGDFPSSQFLHKTSLENHTFIESVGIQTANSCLDKLNPVAFNDKWLFVLCTTKGDINHLKNGAIEKYPPTYLAAQIAKYLPFSAEIEVVSNACVSGVSGVVLAHDYLKVSQYDHAMVLGLDAFSEFTFEGFKSFFALSKNGCKPFDKNRDGLNLGEASAAVVVSKNKEVFEQSPMVCLGGATANDANHISGPSRTGEGLFRAISKTLNAANVSTENVDVINGHGTATPYNDDMESIAFNRAGLSNVPTNSLKGYFGHTLGAAGVLELGIILQCMRNNRFVKTLGLDNLGVKENINVATQNMELPINVALKTASGFGGGNAVILIGKQ